MVFIIKHGLSRSKIYGTYRGMLWRCETDNEQCFKYYKAKRIQVCDEWKGENGFINFYSWAIENGYKENLTLDQKDNTKGYSPDNCRWVNWLVQGNNKSNNHYITYLGECHTISEWSKILGIGKTTIRERLNRGWSVEDVLFRKVLDRGSKAIFQYDKNGAFLKEWNNATDIAKHYNVNRQSVYNVIRGKRKTLKGYAFSHKSPEKRCLAHS